MELASHDSLDRRSRSPVLGFEQKSYSVCSSIRLVRSVPFGSLGNQVEMLEPRSIREGTAQDSV